MLVIFALLVVLLLSGYLVLKNDKLQQKLVLAVTESLSAKVDSKVSLEQIDWSFPNGFIISDVYIEDQNKDTLLFIERSRVTINIFQLFSRKVSFRTLQFTNMHANIAQSDSASAYNFQFLVDAFRKEDADTSSIKWIMDVESVAFNDCSFSLHRKWKKASPEVFNPNSLDVSKLNGCLYVKSFSKDSLNFRLHDISLEEKSGFVLKNLSAALTSNKEQVKVSNFVTELPETRVSLKDFLIKFEDIENLKKDLYDKVDIKLDLGKSVIAPSDLRMFFPFLKDLKSKVLVEGAFRGRLCDLSLRDFVFRYGKTLSLYGDFNLKGLPILDSLCVNAEIEGLSASAADVRELGGAVLQRDIYLSPKFDSVGAISYKGNIFGNIMDMQADGVISSLAGDLSLDVKVKSSDMKFSQYQILGGVDGRSIDFSKIFGKKSHFGIASLGLKVDLCKKAQTDFALSAVGKVDSLMFKDYIYRNISLNGVFDGKGFDGTLVMNDKNAELSFRGSIDMNKTLPEFRFEASVQDAKLVELNLIDGEPNTSLSFDIETNFVGKKIDDIEGSFSVDNILYLAGKKELLINNFSLNAENGGKEKKLTLLSDYVNGSLEGKYSFASVVNSFKNILHGYLPVLVDSVPAENINVGGNDFRFNYTIDNTEPINDVFKLPFVILEESKLSGFYDDDKGKFRLRLESPLLGMGKSNLEDVTVLCENPYDNLKLLVRTTHFPSNKRRNPYFLSFNSNIKNDSIDLKFNFSNSVADTYSGAVSVLSVLKDKTEKGLSADFFVKPTNVILNDTIWKLHGCKIELQPKYLSINNFLLDCHDQKLAIDGVNSESESDSISLSLRGLRLGNISDILNQTSISFDGVADGDVKFFKLFNSPYFTGGLSIHETRLNREPLGDLIVQAGWDKEDKSIIFGADLYSIHNKAKSDIWGGVFLGQDSLFIEGDLKDVDLRFLRQYIGGVLENNTGTVSGKVRSYGKFGSIGLDGVAIVKNFAFDIGYLNTSYVLSDSVFLKPTSIELRECPVFDVDGNHALVSGMVLHEGFKNFKFAVNLRTDNFLALKTSEQDNEMFYGTAYTSGRVNISGTPQEVNFNLNLKTQPNTKIIIPLSNVSSVAEADFIRFVEPVEQLSAAEKRRKRRERLRSIREAQKSKTQMNVNINISATPDAQVQLIMDPVQGDVIKAKGSGDLLLTYNTKDNDFKMYGGYEIDKGEYLFTIQSVISRKFDITEGSVVRWTGDPYDANLDIKAKYFLNASLTEIIDDPSYKVASAQVNCLLGLTGTLAKPNIKFDIDLPNSDEEIKRKLKSVINTEEAVNKNVASLLALGYFYTMDKNGTSGSNELSSVGFSTLSSQISGMLSRINNDLNVGVNYRPASNEDLNSASEFEVALSTQLLNDRLQLYGNFGYRDNLPNANENMSNSIVDFDVEYKLTKSGKFRVKGFNRTNNSYFKQSAQTQGVGLIYREEFDSFGQLMSNYTRPFRNLFRKEKGTKRKEEKIETEVQNDAILPKDDSQSAEKDK